MLQFVRLRHFLSCRAQCLCVIYDMAWQNIMLGYGNQMRYCYWLGHQECRVFVGWTLFRLRRGNLRPNEGCHTWWRSTEQYSRCHPLPSALLCQTAGISLSPLAPAQTRHKQSVRYKGRTENMFECASMMEINCVEGRMDGRTDERTKQ